MGCIVIASVVFFQNGCRWRGDLFYQISPLHLTTHERDTCNPTPYLARQMDALHTYIHTYIHTVHGATRTRPSKYILYSPSIKMHIPSFLSLSEGPDLARAAALPVKGAGLFLVITLYCTSRVGARGVPAALLCHPRGLESGTLDNSAPTRKWNWVDGLSGNSKGPQTPPSFFLD